MATREPDGRAPATMISNGISALHREHYGRGANRSRTHINNDFVVTVMEDPFTKVEKTMIESGAFDIVRETRTRFQDWMRPTFIEIVEEATGRKVAQFFSQVGHDPDYAIECFLLDSSSSSTTQS
jgi:uncharacterized protein YbcI